MKKFLAMLLVVGSLFFTSTVDAEIVKYIGTGNATMSEDENQDAVTKRATTYALRNAREQIEAYVQSFARRQGLELNKDELSTIAVGILKLVDTNVEKALVDDVIQIRVTLTVQVDSDDIRRELDNLDRTEPVVTETINTYSGEGSATIGASETQDHAVNRAESYALSNIRRQVDIDIRTFARTQKLELTNSEVNSVADKVLKITDKTVESSLVNVTIQVRVKITAQINSADLARCIAELARDKNA